jgi:hypothetical protein
MVWEGTGATANFTLGTPSLAAVGSPDAGGSTGGRLSLALTRWEPGCEEVGFAVGLPGKVRVNLAVYDIAGRRRRVLVDGVLPAGQKTVTWDTRDAEWRRVWSGVYFVRLATDGGRRVVKVPIVR